MLQTAVKPNYYALCICALSERLPEDAFRIMDIGSEPRQFDGADVNEILRFKKSLTWKQVGELYGKSGDAVQKRVMRLLERQKISRKSYQGEG